MPISPFDPQQYKGQALVSLTYDDGQKTDFDLALPLHVEFNIRAGFAIISRRALDHQYANRYMERWQVVETRRQGVEIYSHSYSHVHMTELDAAALDFEMKQSKEDLDKMLGGAQPITSFCVPFSDSNDAVIAAAAKYYDAVRVKGKKFTALDSESPVVHSFGLDKNTTFHEIRVLIDKAIEEKAWLTLMLHGVVRDKGPEQRDNDVDSGLLRDIVGYIKSCGADKLLPVTMGDVQDLKKQGLAGKPAAARKSAPAPG